MSQKIKIKHIKCGKVWRMSCQEILAGRGCVSCKCRKTNEQFIKELNKKYKNEIKVLQKYSHSNIPVLIKHVKCGYKWSMTPHTLLDTKINRKCPACIKLKKYSKIAIKWLKEEEKKRKIKIRHAENGGEYRIPGTNFIVDGYCEETNTIYEFYGDDWHGNLKKHKPHSYPHPFTRQTAKELNKKTKNRETRIRAKGYKLKTIWERNWKRRYATQL